MSAKRQTRRSVLYRADVFIFRSGVRKRYANCLRPKRICYSANTEMEKSREN